VFAVFCPRNGADPAQILFEPQGLRWNPAPRRETREGVARPLGSCLAGGSGYRNDADTAENLVASTLRPPSHGAAWRGDGCDNFVAYRTPSNRGAWDTGDRTDALTTGTDASAHVLALSPTLNSGEHSRNPLDEPLVTTLAIQGRGDSHDLEWREDGTANAVLQPGGGAGGIGVGAISTRSQVRRLLPVETERLQGLPDGWTDIPWRGKTNAPDGCRYRAVGNGFAVPVVRWIAERITAAVEHERAAQTASVPVECAA
jgi:DNA (cytosine-5)-methyltransferase 1